MSTTYVKSKSGDFGGSIRPGRLHKAIENEVGITTNLLRINVDDDAINIIFEAALSAGEITILNSLIAGHTTDPDPTIKLDTDGSYNTTTTIKSSQTGNRTIVMPDADDTLVGEAVSQTLTNKRLVSANTEIVDASDSTKRLCFDTSGANAATCVTLRSNQTGNRTIDLPDTDDTLVGATTSQNLTNKNLVDSSVVFVDNVDNTKQVQFQVSGADTATTTTIVSSQTGDRTVTLPDDTTTLIGTDTSQTLTNKTISASSNTITGLTLADISDAGTSASRNTGPVSGNVPKVGTNGLGNDEVVVTNGAGNVESEAKGTAFNKEFGTSAGTISEGNHTHIKSHVTDFSEADYVHTTGTETVAGEKTFNDALTIAHDTNAGLNVTLDPNGRFGAPGASISKGATGGGFLHLMPNSEVVQWIAGSPSASNGVNDFYLDVDNQGILHLNTLGGAGANGDIIATNNAALRPAQDGTSDLGTASYKWDNVYGTTFHGNGSNLTNIDHDSLTNFVSNEHIDHSTVSIIAGEGLAGGGAISATRTLDLDIDNLVTDASPDGSADYLVTYDASASSHKKVLIDNLPIGGGDVTGPGSAVDQGLVRFNGTGGKTLEGVGVRHYGALSSDPTNPTPQAGDQYYNTAINHEMRYDGTRSKWLSVATLTDGAGRNGSTNGNTYYKRFNGMGMSATLGPHVAKGTIIRIGYSTSNAVTHTYEVLVNGSVVASLASGGAASAYDDTLNGDFNAGIMSSRNASGSSSTSYMQSTIYYKLRA